jgi:hypothetical protein
VGIATLSLLTILCLALSAPAFADIYNNGPTGAIYNTLYLDVYAVSDSFTVNTNGTMGSFTFADWVPTGSTPLTADWAIGTSSFGNDIASGTSAQINATFLCSNGGRLACAKFGYDIYLSTVNTGPIDLFTGTSYWLTLTNAMDSFGGRDGWDVNSGPSLAFHNVYGQVPSESFTINAGSSTTSGTTPEPSSIMLFGSAILGLGSIVRRKLF